MRHQKQSNVFSEHNKNIKSEKDVSSMNELQYKVNGMTCNHCVNAITTEVKNVQGVSEVNIDLETKIVKVTGNDVSDKNVREAIKEAGYEAQD
jgi:copper chaperone